ncbi:hypothetical protein B0H17DRAFT_1135932 [Mycena rosella]|uniref:Uncharacterized protein n=1 Tax=Mycena rosella TaxID=1033263 RepID=A0AAD7DDQ8_MYCRO|nr:hypothetical protein B0H17DRAFT_1135932 [Mycena rosella]
MDDPDDHPDESVRTRIIRKYFCFPLHSVHWESVQVKCYLVIHQGPRLSILLVPKHFAQFHERKFPLPINESRELEKSITNVTRASIDTAKKHYTKSDRHKECWVEEVWQYQYLLSADPVSSNASNTSAAGRTEDGWILAHKREQNSGLPGSKNAQCKLKSEFESVQIGIRVQLKGSAGQKYDTVEYRYNTALRLSSKYEYE